MRANLLLILIRSDCFILLRCRVVPCAIMMEEQTILHFPYEFEELKPEESEFIDSIYGSIERIYSSYRVGPKGYIVYEPYKFEAANIYNMPLRSTDIFVATYQRSGTTLTQELVWLLANNFDYTTSAKVPLIHRYEFIDLFMLFDLNRLDVMMKNLKSHLDDDKVKAIFTMMAQPATKVLASMPETVTRFIKTHLPMSLLNPKLLDTAKMVYVARDPRDVAVSCYHHARLFKESQFPGSFKEFWNIFFRGLYCLCPIFEHVKEAWEQRHHPNMLFLFYEELTKELPTTIRRIADFLGKDITQEEMDGLCDHLSFEKFKNNKSVNLESLRDLGMLKTDETFVRKGKAGGWRDYFDEEMTLQAEQWITDNLRDTDLRFPHMNI